MTNTFKNGSRYIVLGLFFSILFIGFASTPALAQTESPMMCPVTDALSALVRNANPVELTDNTLINTVIIANASEYIFEGVHVAVAVYAAEDTTTPLFWTILPQEIALGPKETTALPLKVNVENIPPGEYVYQAVATQGDELQLLGTILREKVFIQARFTKTTTVVLGLVSSVTVNDTAVPNETTFLDTVPLNVSVVTKNVGTEPYFDSQLFVALADNNIPLGDAVRVSKIDSLKLLPGSERVTSVTDQFVSGGGKSIFVAGLTPGFFEPISIIPLQVGQYDASKDTSYISEVALTTTSSKDTLGVVVCTESVNIATVRAIPAYVTLSLFDVVADNNIFEDEENTERNNHVRFITGATAEENIITASLLSPRQQSQSRSQAEVEANKRDGLVETQRIAFTLNCERFDMCAQSIKATTENFVADKTVQQSFWFYLGIILAALLLGVLVIRRLGDVPKNEDVPMHKPE